MYYWNSDIGLKTNVGNGSDKQYSWTQILFCFFNAQFLEVSENNNNYNTNSSAILYVEFSGVYLVALNRFCDARLSIFQYIVSASNLSD